MSASRRPSSTCCASSWPTRAGSLSKAQILDHVWHYDFGGDGGVVETYIGYLRRKVDDVEPAPDPHHPRGRLRAAGAVECRSVDRGLLPPASALVGLASSCSAGCAVAVTRSAAEGYLVAQVDDRLPALDDDRPVRRPPTAGTAATERASTARHRQRRRLRSAPTTWGWSRATTSCSSGIPTSAAPGGDDADAPDARHRRRPGPPGRGRRRGRADVSRSGPDPVASASASAPRAATTGRSVSSPPRWPTSTPPSAG